MKLTAWTTLACLLMYIWIFAKVGLARKKFGINAPETQGPVAFLSVLRVQANTVEQLVLFLPALWMCAYFLNDQFSALTGLVWVAGRIIYALGYYQAPEKRSIGFGIASLSTMVLIAGTVAGLTHVLA